MSESTCNGWTNYATWRIHLELCADTCDMYIGDGVTFDSVDGLVEDLKDSVDDALTNYGEITEGPTLDYARSFVEGVNFHEIASRYQDELIATDADEDEDDDAA